MKERGVKVKPLWDSKLSDNPNLKTFIYERDGYSFVGSKIGKDYTPKGLATIFKANIESQMAPTVKTASTAPTPAAAPQPHAPVISLSAPSLGSQTAADTNMVLGGGLSDDFAHFLKMHPGLSIEEAKRKFKEQQKLKAQQRKGPKMPH